LPKIRVHTNHDMEDAVSFARELLANVAPPTLLSAEFSQDLLAATVLVSAYETPDDGMGAVLHYLVDPLWDSPKQILASFTHQKFFEQPAAAAWQKEFSKEVGALWGESDQSIRNLLDAAKLHWSTALGEPQKTVGDKKPVVEPKPVTTQVQKPARTIEVFCPEALDKAAAAIRDMNSDRRAAGARILDQARGGAGNRDLPDATQASKNLEAKKLNFENLLQPIERLQTDLVLAAAMRAQDFRISPLLLLGEPGIGKTFLANQLAGALGVPSEKISAGGAQSAFQLTGSHSTWQSAKPGMIATLLAKSASAAPVLVIDEVDKIHEDRHAFLPVLLDLLDAGTAKRFRDEYFEMEFDASRIIVVLTANDISKVPPPLLSRVEAFTVPAPQPGQRLRIIAQTMADLSEKTGRPITFAAGVGERLAERMDIDLRQLTRLVRASFATALQAGDKVARLKAPDAIGPVGFSLREWTPAKEQYRT
jgi:ATP-dependent Lon protease